MNSNVGRLKPITITLAIEESLVMAKAPELDVAAAHKYFSAHCFNKAWDLIEKTDRTPEDERSVPSLRA